jgi:hypothetical protein
MLKLGDEEFAFKAAEFSAFISLGQEGWKVNWDFEFRAKSKEVAGMDWKPHISTHYLCVQLPSLDELPGKSFDVSEFIDDEPAFMIYLMTHEPVINAKIGFGKWRGNSIEFTLTGNANVCDEPGYEGDLPLKIECLLPFSGVYVSEPNLEKATAHFTKNFEMKYFRQPEKRDSGYFFALDEIHAKT